MPAKTARPTTAPAPFDLHGFLDSTGLSRPARRFARGSVVFAQGAQADSVFYIRKGSVKLSVLAASGKEAVVAMFGPGDFFGEGCLAGQPRRIATAAAITPSAIHVIGETEMVRLLHEQHALSDRVISHMLARNNSIEQDLIGQLFNSSEKRLARALLTLARYGTQDPPLRVLRGISQKALAGMVGTTRSRVTFLMNKFTRLGFIGRGRGGLTIDGSLLNVVLHD
jgi:CRP-like cAMP-binding protein